MTATVGGVPAIWGLGFSWNAGQAGRDLGACPRYASLNSPRVKLLPCTLARNLGRFPPRCRRADPRFRFRANHAVRGTGGRAALRPPRETVPISLRCPDTPSPEPRRHRRFPWDAVPGRNSSSWPPGGQAPPTATRELPSAPLCPPQGGSAPRAFTVVPCCTY